MIDPNPIGAMAELSKEQRIINAVKSEIQNLKEAKMKFIEFDIFYEVGSNRLVKKVSVNPAYISYIREDGEHSYVYMSNEAILHALPTRDAILNLINGETSSYIK